MKLWLHRYQIVLRAGNANAQTARRLLDGVLVRADDGIGCVHPWPELGDDSLEEQIAALRCGARTQLIARALAAAKRDGAARREGRSLFRGLTIPRSHATVIDAASADFAALRAAGFPTVKVKASGGASAIIDALRLAMAAGLRLRVDFNGTATAAAMECMAEFRAALDFVEDPVPLDPDEWKSWRDTAGVPLALDRATAAEARMMAGAFDVRIVKPALMRTPRAPATPVVFTSYMDHPLGQLHAAYEAAQFSGPQSEAGLLTHTLFEPDAFIDAMRSDGPQLLPPEGTGIGFDRLLESLPWERADGTVPDRRNPVLWERAEFWHRRQPLLLTNPRAPLHDEPDELPCGHLVFPTSGSGGGPKLVCLTREAMLANAAAVNARIDAGPQDVWLRVLPWFHVGGLSIHARAFLSGTRVVTDWLKWNPRRFVSLVREAGVTLTSLVPAQVFDLVADGLIPPASLRAVFAGGGALPVKLEAEARSLGWPLLPCYGLTEAASQVATARGEPEGAAPETSLELLPGWEARISAGGLLELRGPALLSGYLVRHDEEWQMEPACGSDGWFTTSDRASLDGRKLTISGRTGRTVKILGEFVDPDAVERALHAAGLAPESGCVMAWPDGRRGHRLVLMTEIAPPESVLAAYHAACAPFARIMECLVRPLPRSALGKIQRAALACEGGIDG